MTTLRVLVLGDDSGVGNRMIKQLARTYIPPRVNTRDIVFSEPAKDDPIAIRLLRDYDLKHLHPRATDQYGRPCKVEPLWLARQRSKTPR